MLQQQMGQQNMGIQPQNMPSNQGLRMPGSSSGLGYGTPGNSQGQGVQGMPNVGNANVNQSQGLVNPSTNANTNTDLNSSNMPSNPVNSQAVNPNTNPQIPIQQQPLFTQPQQPQMQLSPEMLALSLNPQFQMIKAQVQQNPGYLQ